MKRPIAVIILIFLAVPAVAMAAEKKEYIIAGETAGLTASFITGILIIFLVCSVILIKFWEKKAQIALPVRIKPPAKINRKILVDPDIPTLRKILGKTGKNRIPFTLTLPARPGLSEGPSFACEAELTTGVSKPKVFFAGEDKPIGWDERRRHAAMLTQSKLQAMN